MSASGVLEGDVQGSLDADRLAHLHIPVVQLNTGAGFGGECHLDANMVSSALEALPLSELDLLVIENVGNLVCPAEFRVGEDVRMMVASVTEGEDKPLKYPLMFRACELVVVNKIDLLPHLDYDLAKFDYYLDQVHPGCGARCCAARAPARGSTRSRSGCRTRRRHAPRARSCGRGVNAAPAHARRTRPRTRGPASAYAGQCPLLRTQSQRLARLCHQMAERFARGGRLIALAASPAARSDARHVAVEFVHPVIVGKRALPAFALIGADALGCPGPARSAPTTSRWRSAPAWRGHRCRPGRRVPHHRLRRRRGRVGASRRPSATRSSARRSSRRLYHVLWELVHVFFEHRGLLGGRAQRAHHDAEPRPSCIRSWPSPSTTSMRCWTTCGARR